MTNYRTETDLNAEGWHQLAVVDESEDYEVDRAAIYVHEDGRFMWRTATGCSCWDGEWDETFFGGFDLLVLHILGDNGDRRNPSLDGAATMIDAAEAKMRELGIEKTKTEVH